jgi:hypothetical protein
VRQQVIEAPTPNKGSRTRKAQEDQDLSASHLDGFGNPPYRGWSWHVHPANPISVAYVLEYGNYINTVGTTTSGKARMSMEIVTVIVADRYDSRSHEQYLVGVTTVYAD